MANDHGPISPEFYAAMNELAHDLDAVFNGEKKGEQREVGFCLLVFPFNDNELTGRMNYISNAQREDMLVAMKEFIRKNEGMNMPVARAVQ